MSLKDRVARSLRRTSDRCGEWAGAFVRDLRVWSDFRAFPPLAVWSGVHCVAAMLLVRRFFGLASPPFTSTQLCVTATIAAALLVAARAMLARIEVRPPAFWLRFVVALLGAVPIIALFFGGARRLSLGTTAFLGGLACLVAVMNGLWNREFFERLLTSFFMASPGVSESTHRQSLKVNGDAAKSDAQPHDATETLRMKRLTSADGSEQLEGTIIAEFACGQGITTVHIPFLPTFPRVPELTCTIDERAAARIKGTSIYPYGCRVELKRTGILSAPARIELRFTAMLRSSRHAA